MNDSPSESKLNMYGHPKTKDGTYKNTQGTEEINAHGTELDGGYNANDSIKAAMKWEAIAPSGDTW